jgi:sec-independent protein translocase protein TatA
MFGLGTTELIIILVLVMIVFGAGKLPQVAKSLGKGVREFKDGMDPNLINDEDLATEEKKEA